MLNRTPAKWRSGFGTDWNQPAQAGRESCGERVEHAHCCRVSLPSSAPHGNMVLNSHLGSVESEPQQKSVFQDDSGRTKI